MQRRIVSYHLQIQSWIFFANVTYSIILLDSFLGLRIVFFEAIMPATFVEPCNLLSLIGYTKVYESYVSSNMLVINAVV